jgi:chemotaxis protein MotB
MMMVALLWAATACVSPEAHRKVLGANDALVAQIAGLAEAQKTLAAENDRLRNENGELGRRAVDATFLAEQKQKLADLLARYGEGTPAAVNGVELVSTAEGYAFRVAGGVLFAAGQTALTEQGKRALSELSSSLQGRAIRVEGHTDDQPITRSQWGTNLRLSAERSLAVADFLINTAGLKATQVSVAGYGEYRPAVAGNDEPSRQKNRRVEILLIER